MKDNCIQIKRLDSVTDAGFCADMMANSEPWITLNRGKQESLEIINDPSREVYIAWLQDEIAGFIIVEMSGTFKGYIKSICVSPSHRNKGIGSKLMSYTENRILSETPNVFLLVSSFNTGALRLYKRLGYERIGELKDFIIEGYSEILMRKTIGPLTYLGRDA